MISNREYKILKYIKKHPRLPDIIKHFNFEDYFELYHVFSESQRIQFSDSQMDSDTMVSITPKTLVEFDEFRRKSFQFWLPITGSVIAFFRPEIFSLINWVIELCSQK